MTRLLHCFTCLLLLPALLRGGNVSAQSSTMPQQLAFAGLRAVAQQGQFNATAVDASGNVILLLDQRDGVRLLKVDPIATTILAQALIGAAGDIGLAMTLDPAGNIYVTGTSTSGSLTGTSGAAFPNAVDTTVNSFVAKFDANLKTVFITFGGSGRAAASAISATADAVFITGLIYGSGLPVTPSAIVQAPAYGSAQNGFVERFSADGKTLNYATYLSGQGGDTSPTVLTVDAQDDAYVAGFTSATGFPTVAALIPRAVGTTSGFLIELTPAADGIVFSTFIPGSGISSITLEGSSKSLLLSGTIALGQFPVTNVSLSSPLVNTPYQVLLRMPLDGSAVLSSTVLAPGTASYLTPGPGGTVWVGGNLSTPLLPEAPISSVGTGFALRIASNGVVDQTARFGGLPVNNPGYASIVGTLTSLAVDSSGAAYIAGGMAPTTSTALLATQTFDLPLTNTPTNVLPSALHDAVLTAAACPNSSACAGSAAYLAKIVPTEGASLALSTDGAPTVVLRNLGSAQATGLAIATNGFTPATTCGASLNAGAECTIVLSGGGPGTLTVTATNATTQTASLAAIPPSVVPQTLIASPKELDFGVQSGTSPPQTKVITITNLGSQTQSFTSAVNGHVPYTFAESASDCTTNGVVSSKQLAAGATCHITLSFAASTDSARNGPAQANWVVGPANVLLTAFSQAAALSVSATEIDFGTQFYGGLHSSRSLYLSNVGATAVPHTPVALPANSPFTLTDNCSTQLAPQSVCQILLNYRSPVSTASDSTTLALDNGLSVLVTGQTIPQPGTSGSSAPPSLVVTPSSLNFPTAVVVTGVSSTTQNVTIQNTGTSAFTLGLTLTGDFTQQTACPASLAANASCTVILSFAPSQPGARTGLLGVSAGASAPAYVNLSGTATPILPANNGTFDFGPVPLNQPAVQWYKVSQPFSSLTAGIAPSSAPFKVLLVEDIGYGHGAPPASAFLSATTGTCANCWLGIQFTPTTAGAQTATLSLLSALNGNPYTLALTGSGVSPTGIALSPLTKNFGPVDVNSASAAQLFTVTNLAATSTSLSAPALTGDFQLVTNTDPTPCTSTLAANASCTVAIAFAPTAVGQRIGTLTLTAGSATASAALSGTGMADPGVAFSATALAFNNVPGAAATQQSLTVTNTGNVPLQVGTPTNTSPAFAATTTCASLAVAATCTVTVTFTPQMALVTDTLEIPVTATVGGSPVTTNYPIGLSGNYTAVVAGLQITPATVNYGPFSTDTVGATRLFTIASSSAKTLALNLPLPRQFLLAGPACTSLAPNGTCTFSATFVPVTNGDITGSLTAQGVPTDGSATLSTIAYLEGFGNGTTTLSVTGNLQPGGLLNFGQVASGQSAAQTLTLTNTTTASASPNTVTVRRVTSQSPFLSTTTCGGTLAPAQSCTVTLTYTPLNQIASGGSTPPASTDTGILTLESDAISSPNTVNLTGTSSPVVVSAPNNTAPTPTVALSASSLVFPATAVGNNSPAQTVTLTNSGTATLHVTGLAASTDFAVSGTCPAAMLPGTTCTFNVVFSPQVAGSSSGSRLGTLEIASDAATSLEFLSLLGSTSAAALTFQPTALNFGGVLVGRTATLPVQIANTGSSAITLTTLSATGDYAVSGNCPAAGAALAANTSCTAQVAFTPTVAGTRNGILALTNSASANPLSLLLQGTGTLASLQVSPSTLNFGSVAVGSSSTLSLTLTNAGSSAITALTFAPTGDFTVTSPCSVSILAGGASCSLTLTFLPSALGTRAGTLTIASSDPSSPLAVRLSGTGTAAQSTLQITPSPLTFGSVAVGTSATQSLTLKNIGTTAITGITLALTGDFAVTTPCPATLAPQATCTATIGFTPATAGTRSGTLTLTSSDPGSPATIPVSGTGAGSFLLTVDGGEASTATVTQTHTATYALAVTPQGGFTGQVVLSCSPSSTAAPNSACTILPAALTLGTTAQTATVTINTLTSAAQSLPLRKRLDPISLCFLAPAAFLFWRFRKTLPKQRLSLLLVLVCTSLALLVSGCGGGNNTLHLTPTGSYQFTVTANSTTGTVASQTVTLNLTVN